MNPKRFRPNLIHVYLHPEEDKFVKKYAERNYLSVSELIRYWIHQSMKKEGLLKDVSINTKPRRKGRQ